MKARMSISKADLYALNNRTPDQANLSAVKRELYRLCSQFVLENQITCPESIYQVDHVIANAYEFLDEMCGIIGYAEPRDEGDEEQEEE